MSFLEKAEWLLEGAKNASEAGDAAAAIELAIEAAQYLQLARLFDSGE